MDSLINSLLEGDGPDSIAQVKRLLSTGVSVERIVVDGVEEAMRRLDEKCTVSQFNLLEIMLVGRSVTNVMTYLYPDGSIPAGSKGTIVLATLEGDIHDLGKNILKTVLMGNGYRVVDCGKDCPLQKLIDVAKKEFPLAVGISGLVTSIVPLVRQVRDSLRACGLEQVKVFAGGAALKQSSAERLNVDYLGESAFDGANYLNLISQEVK